MVMKPQGEGLSREVRTRDAQNKATEYTIYDSRTGTGTKTEVGYTKRVVSGSVSTWEGYLRTGESTYAVFPETDKNHSHLMEALAGKFSEQGAVPSTAPAETTTPTVSTPAAVSTGEAADAVPAPATPPVAKRPRGKSKAARAAERMEQDQAALAVPTDAATSAASPSAETDSAPATLPPSSELPPGHADPAVQAEVEAAFQADEAASAAAVVEAGAVEPGDADDAALDPEVVEIVAVDPETGDTETAVAVLEHDGTVDVMVAGEPPAVVFQEPGSFGGNPFADPLRDPLGPAFADPQ